MPPSPGLASKLLTEARRGLPPRVVARLARIKPPELAKWIEEGDQEGADAGALRFTQDWHESQCLFIADQHEAIAVSRMSGRDEPNTGARLALLERLWPEDYGRRGPAAEAPPAPSNVPAAVAELDPETRAELKAALDRRRQQAGGRHL